MIFIHTTKTQSDFSFFSFYLLEFFFLFVIYNYVVEATKQGIFKGSLAPILVSYALISSFFYRVMLLIFFIHLFKK